MKLRGQRVVVTRDRSQSGGLADLLAQAGAEVVELPVIAIRPPPDPEPLRAAARSASCYQWLVFTSANAVKFFFEAGPAMPLPAVCAIGPATARAVTAHGATVALQPADAVAESLVEALRDARLEGARVLLPQARGAREVVAVGLRALGAKVDVVEAYRNVTPEGLTEAAERVFGSGVDWVTFTSGSTVKNLLAAVSPDALAGVRLASIGPVTSEWLRRHGLRVDAEARPHTAEGLVAAMEGRP
ncbi:MAG: uroporphyrinogen-III synthase [Bryobacteraceae bacterium]|nr:uroporphyrinogen-III synthase [Bryobacteraceae bacterium]